MTIRVNRAALKLLAGLGVLSVMPLIASAQVKGPLPGHLPPTGGVPPIIVQPPDLPRQTPTIPPSLPERQLPSVQPPTAVAPPPVAEPGKASRPRNKSCWCRVWNPPAQRMDRSTCAPSCCRNDSRDEPC